MKKRGTEECIRDVFCRNIGVNSIEEVNDWFKKSYSNDYKIKDLTESVEYAKIFKDETVTIVGDYDVDGVVAVFILMMSLKWAGFKDVRYRIPRRFSEGYGISTKIVDEIESGLLITCDNGIAQPVAIKKAKNKGLGVIIIDHHLPAADEAGNILIPNADFIIDPNAIEGSADFNGYCGAGLCYKFACELLGQEMKFYTQLLQGATAVATVCDVMELREENYVFVRNGLKKLLMPNLNTTGLYALVSAFQLTKHISAHDVGFKIGPAINACSRMKDDGATEALELLLYSGPFQTAIKKAEEIVSVNDARKAAKKEALIKAESVIAEQCLYGDIPLVLYVPGISEGLIGILAGNLSEKYQTPAFIFTDSENPDELKGSARAFGNYHVKNEMDKCPDLFERFGGHAGAGGMTIKRDNLEELRRVLSDNISDYVIPDDEEETYYDLEINASDIPKVLAELEAYEPFGEGNPQVIFKVNDFSVVPRYGSYKKLIGDDESIVKLYSSNSTAIGFDMADKMKRIEKPNKLDLVGTLSYNYFNGNVDNQIEFFDFYEKKFEMKETDFAARLRTLASSMS